MVIAICCEAAPNHSSGGVFGAETVEMRLLAGLPARLTEQRKFYGDQLPVTPSQTRNFW